MTSAIVFWIFNKFLIDKLHVYAYIHLRMPRGAGEMVQLVKCLTCEYEDLSLDSQESTQKGTWWHTLITVSIATKESDRWTPGSLWERSWPTEFRPIKALKKIGGGTWGLSLKAVSDMLCHACVLYVHYKYISTLKKVSENTFGGKEASEFT